MGIVGPPASGELTAEQVLTENIKNLAVTAAKLAASAVTAEKLAANAVTTEKLKNEAVTAEKLASGVGGLTAGAQSGLSGKTNGTLYEPSATKWTLVTLQLIAESGQEPQFKITVAGQVVGRFQIFKEAAEQETMVTILVAPGEKFKVEATGGIFSSTFRTIT